MKESATILDYAYPSRSRWRQGFRWLLLERQLTAGEVAFGGWALFAVSYVLFVARMGGAQQAVVLMLSSMVTGSIATLLAALHMLVARRYALAGLLVLVALITSLVGGIVQFDRCPHATYVQIIGPPHPRGRV